MFTPTNKQLLDLLIIKESHCMNVYKKNNERKISLKELHINK